MKHFIYFTKPSKDSSLLPLLDKHTTHSRNIESSVIADVDGVIMLQCIQRTGCAFRGYVFKPLQNFYNNAVQKCGRATVVSQFKVCQILSETYAKAVTIKNVIGPFVEVEFDECVGEKCSMANCRNWQTL